MPKSGPISRLKNAPRDQIPVTKTPRRQKSSRFYAKEKIQLERTPGFNGNKKKKKKKAEGIKTNNIKLFRNSSSFKT